MKLLKKQDFSSKKMRNSGNCIYKYAHSFFGEDFYPNKLHWCIRKVVRYRNLGTNN